MTNTIKTRTFPAGSKIPENIIFPQQSHGARIVEIITGNEDLTNCDGLWTHLHASPSRGGLGGVENSFLLGVKTADCAPICLWNEHQYGVLHAGWRGLVNGAVENMLEIFSASSPLSERGDARRAGVFCKNKLNIYVGPLLPQFEIQRDECYDLIYEKFGSQFFTKIKVDLKNQKTNKNNQNTKSRSTLVFEFKKCLASLLPPQAVFDERSTFNDPTLSSWRRDKHFNNGQNVTVIGNFFSP